MPTTSDFERMLRGVALRVTRPRVAVLSAVHQAVYDGLRALTAAGLVDSGYEIDEADVIYWGRCTKCVTATSAASGG